MKFDSEVRSHVVCVSHTHTELGKSNGALAHQLLNPRPTTRALQHPIHHRETMNYQNMLAALGGMQGAGAGAGAEAAAVCSPPPSLSLFITH